MFDAAPMLRDVFGFDDFRPGQEEIVDAVTAGRKRAGDHADGWR